MGFLARVSSVASPARMRAATPDPLSGFWYTPEGWLMQLSSAGMTVSPELAMTLSAVYCAVTTIADDIASMPCHVYRYVNEDGDKERARNHPLSYLIRWQPNVWQTAKEFWSTILGHYLLRNVAYAEIIPGARGAVDQLIPRHPDRVQQERLPSGRIRFRKVELDGTVRYMTQDEVFVLRDLTSDGVVGLGRIAYGREAIASGLSLQQFTNSFFRNGTTAAMVAVHKGGELDEAEKKALHTSISMYTSGAENAGGLLVIEDDIDIKSLGVEPEKAQLLGLKDYSVREVARLYKMPGHKLEASQQTQAYAAREQANLEYLMGTLRPIIVGIEQSIQRDLIIAKATYFAEFLMEALLRGDTKSRADYFERAIQNRWMWPSEVRRREGMNADKELDALSKLDHRAGSNAERGGRDRDDTRAHRDFQRLARAERRVLQFVRTGAERVVHKELEAVSKAAKRYADDVDGWKTWLRDFYEDHAQFAAQVLCMPIEAARLYAAQHGAALEQRGVGVLEEWKATEIDALSAHALEPVEAAAA